MTLKSRGFNYLIWKKEIGRKFTDIMLRLMFFACRGEHGGMSVEAARYNFMWEVWIEGVSGGYMSPPEPEYHADLIGPKWLNLAHPYCY